MNSKFYRNDIESRENLIKFLELNLELQKKIQKHNKSLLDEFTTTNVQLGQQLKVESTSIFASCTTLDVPLKSLQSLQEKNVND